MTVSLMSSGLSDRTTSPHALRGELRTIKISTARTPNRSNSDVTSRKYWSGRDWQLGTAAYWETIAAEANRPSDFRLGENLIEEIAACLLGGYGIPASLAEAAFKRLHAAGTFDRGFRGTVRDIEILLNEPLLVSGSWRRYRFPRQKARRLVEAIEIALDTTPPLDPVVLRDWLMELPGIGPKTASWVVRNHTGSNAVAVIDIHIIRAGTAAGVFAPTWQVARDYRLFEQAFLQWAAHAEVDASFLDACIWGALAHAGRDARDILGTPSLSLLPPAVWPVDTDSGAAHGIRSH